MFHGRHISRRISSKNVAVTAGAFAVPHVIPASALGLDDAVGAEQPHHLRLYRLRRSRGGLEFRSRCFATPTPRSSPFAMSTGAICNIAKSQVDAHYGQQLGKDYKGCTAYGDFRELINRKDIDVVGIATPDHWHVIPAIMAAKAGKDVIGEKPMTLTVAEGRILSDVMKQTGRIFQTASENRSIDTYIRLIELVRGGVVGKLKHIEVRLPMGTTTPRVGGEARELVDYQHAAGTAEDAELRDVAGPGPLDALHSRPAATATSAGIWPSPGACSPIGAPTWSTWPSGATTPSTPARCRSRARAISRRVTPSTTRPRRSRSTTSTPTA